MYSEFPFIRNPFIRKTRDPEEIRRERIFCAVICLIISGNPRSGTGQRFQGANLCIYLYFLLVNPEESLALGLNRPPLSKDNSAPRAVKCCVYSESRVMGNQCAWLNNKPTMYMHLNWCRHFILAAHYKVRGAMFDIISCSLMRWTRVLLSWSVKTSPLSLKCKSPETIC